MKKSLTELHRKGLGRKSIAQVKCLTFFLLGELVKEALYELEIVWPIIEIASPFGPNEWVDNKAPKHSCNVSVAIFCTVVGHIMLTQALTVFARSRLATSSNSWNEDRKATTIGPRGRRWSKDMSQALSARRPVLLLGTRRSRSKRQYRISKIGF